MTSFSARIKRGTLVKTSLAAVMLSSMAMFQSAHAVGTAAGTDITNTATVNFSVGGVAQTPVNSNTTTFEVDRKVDLTVTNGAATSTAPNATNVAVIFTVTNTGNGTDSFTFAPTNLGSDNFDVSNMRVYRDNGATPNVFDGGDTLIAAATPVSFTADQSIVFFIVSDIPATPTNTQFSDVRLTATTTSTETAGADNPAVVDVVFVDTDRDGIQADDNRYNISAATLAVVKSAAIISDPVNGTAANRKAIPGAVIEYTIVVTNSGAANATSVALSDNIPANTTYVPASMTLNAGALTDAADADAGTFTGTAVNVNAGTVTSGGGTATITFRVTIIAN
jgi:uncharacterized repeat protein (TIGR01451 family)